MRIFHPSKALVIFLALSTVQCYGAETGEHGMDLEVKLRSLKPLPKVHYSSPLPTELMEPQNNGALYELARIIHSLSLSGEWCTKERVDTCVRTCQKVNNTKPNIKASLAINFSPWHRKFGKNLPPTDRGPTYKEELEFFVSRLKTVKQWVEEGNKKFGSEVAVSALILDSERFYAQDGNSTWNDAIRDNLDQIHKLGLSIFPEARIEWYGRGIQRIWGGDGWGRTNYFTGKEIKAPLSCALYSVPEPERTQETYRRTCALADELGIREVTPYVALASGYRRGLVKKQYWDFDWKYDLIYSLEIGSELNIHWFAERPKRFAQYDRATVVIFYPAPFDKRVPGWATHFIAYVRGATGVEDLSDLGWKEPTDK